MRLTQPKVYLIAKPQIMKLEMEEYLKDVGAEDRPAGIVDLSSEYGGEILAEFSGRLDYKSWKPQLNKNVTRIRGSIEEYLKNILDSHHGTVTESSFYVFVLHNVSRVLTAELCRHRAGVSISEQSLRYVRLEEIGMWLPEWAQRDEELFNRCVWLISQIEQHQKWMAEHFGLDKSKNFSDKKEKTSFMRRFANMGLSTEIIFGANVRALRHILEMRTSIHAEAEIRLVMGMIAEIMIKECPLLFSDFTRDDQGQWIPRNSKI